MSKGAELGSAPTAVPLSEKWPNFSLTTRAGYTYAIFLGLHLDRFRDSSSGLYRGVG
jgi:hypothetical protein